MSGLKMEECIKGDHMDLMIDIETLGVRSNCPVISIGACFFDKDGIKEKFYAVLDVAEQIDSGKRVADASTIKWWMGQEGAAQKIFRDNIGIPTMPEVMLREVPSNLVGYTNLGILLEFYKFCNLHENAKPWGNGSNFDITIMERILQDYNVKTPWNFRNIRDLRTFKEYVYDGSETERVGTHHNALDDAIYQAQVVIDGLNSKEQKEIEKGEELTNKSIPPKPTPTPTEGRPLRSNLSGRINEMFNLKRFLRGED